MLASIDRHARHHIRFYVAALFGVVTWAGSATLETPLRLAIAGDSFFVVYLVLMTTFSSRTTRAALRQRADVEDEGGVLIVLIALTTITFCLASIFSLLNREEALNPVLLAFSIASAPLGWLTLHTIGAFHYAHLYYAEAPSPTGERKDAKGLKFPGPDEPTAWDFLYYSFVVGMTAQVSDVQITSTSMRRLTLVHGIVSFFFNTVILALAVNVVLSQAL